MQDVKTYALNKAFMLCMLALLLNSCLNDKSKTLKSGKLVTHMKEMFHEMVEKKDASLMAVYYHPEFLLFSNGMQMDFDQIVKAHEKVFATPIQYTFKFDEYAVLEQDDKVAMRVFITTKRPDEQPREIELILIAQYKDGKIYRAWELTFPDWSQLPAFEDVI